MKWLSLSIPLLLFSGCNTLLEFIPYAQKVEENISYLNEPSLEEKKLAIKTLIERGIENVVPELSQESAFSKDSELAIGFPPDALHVKSTLEKRGHKALLNEIETLLNDGAGHALREAEPLLKSSIDMMPLDEINRLLYGHNAPIANHFAFSTRYALEIQLRPTTVDALKSSKASSAWREIAVHYNSIDHSHEPIDTDLVRYLTVKALDGFFYKLKDYEQEVREDPEAHPEELVQYVFAFVEKHRNHLYTKLKQDVLVSASSETDGF